MLPVETVLLEWRVAGPVQAGPVLVRPVRAGGAWSFGPRYIHDVRNAAAAAVAVSVHAYSPPLPAMTRYELTPAGLVRRNAEAAVARLIRRCPPEMTVNP